MKKYRFDFIKDETWENRVKKLIKLFHMAYYDLYINEKNENNIDITEDEIKYVQGRNNISWLNKLKNWFGELR
jgi:hypothetical protein